MSEKRLQGWEPQEFHEFIFDDDGRHVGTVVTRDPEWDDEQRSRMLALAEYEAGIHGCGFHRSIAFDQANGFTFEVETCPLCAGIEQQERRLAERDKREKDAAGDMPPWLSSDGRSVYVKQLTDEEHEALKAKRFARLQRPPPDKT